MVVERTEVKGGMKSRVLERHFFRRQKVAASGFMALRGFDKIPALYGKANGYGISSQKSASQSFLNAPIFYLREETLVT